MYKVLVVDDEKAIRDNIARVVPFEANGFIVCGTAKNGVEAQKAVVELKPDLIMLDVNMPVMDGLTFLEQLRKGNHRHIKVIMLSGYNDFEYARKAMRYEVKAYMTKPIDEDEAEILLKEVSQELAIEKHNRDMTSAKYRLETFKKMYAGGVYNKTLLEDCFILHVVVCDDQRQQGYENATSTLDMIQEAIKGIFGEDNYSVAKSRGCIHSFIMSMDSIKNSPSLAKIYADKTIKTLWDHKLNVSILVDYELLKVRNKSLREDYSNNLYLMCSELFYTDKKYIQFLDLADKVYGYNLKSKKQFLDEFKSHMLSMNFQKVITGFDELSAEIKELKISIEVVHEVSFRVYYLMLDLINRLQLKDIIDMPQPPEWRDKLIFTNYQQWERLMNQEINQLIRGIKTNFDKNQNSQCYEIIQYVKDHYKKNISIKELADQFFLNSAYVGRMFKKETGTTIKQYICDLRLEESKVLLLNTDKKVYEIASDLGYTESKYFIAKFSNKVGCSPSQYRKQKAKRGDVHVSAIESI